MISYRKEDICKDKTNMGLLFYLSTILIFYCLLVGGVYIVSTPNQPTTRLFIYPLSGVIVWISTYLLPLLAPILQIDAALLTTYVREMYGISALGALILAVGVTLFVCEYPIRHVSSFQKQLISGLGLGIVILFGFLIFQTEFIFLEPLTNFRIAIGQGYALLTGGFTILYAIIFTALITSLKEAPFSKQKRGGILLLLVIFAGFSTPYISTIILPLFTGFLQFTWWGLLGPLIGGMIFMYALFTQNIFDLKIAGIDLLLLAMAFVLMSITVSSSSVVAFGFNLLTLIIFGILAFFLIHELLLEKQRQYQIAEANQTLSETVDAKENFLRLTSHQLRTPLSSIEGYLNMLLKSPTEEYGYPAEVRTYLEKAHINYQRLNSIVEDISVANKISTDHWNMHTEPNLDPLQIVHEVVEYNQYVAKEHDVSITKNIDPEDIFLEGNQSLLFEALDNLIRNSIIYGSTSVEIRVKIKDDALHIKIIDDGIGITEEEMSAVYQRFQRADRAEREYPDGSGIGIYIAKAIIEKHEGSLDIYSNGADKGTVVTIVLPFSAPNE